MLITLAWLYNLRAHDVPHFPVALAYTIIKENDAMIYIDASRLDEESKTLFAQNHIQVKDYEAIYEDVKTLEGPVLVDGNFVNSKIVYSLNTEIVYAQDPIVLLKAMKNETELANTRNAHIKDGVACTKFMYWLMQNVNNGISEMSAQEKLQELRKEQADYLEDSFNTICAYKEHAAMMHYSSNEETNVEFNYLLTHVIKKPFKSIEKYELTGEKLPTEIKELQKIDKQTYLLSRYVMESVQNIHLQNYFMKLKKNIYEKFKLKGEKNDKTRN